MKMFVIGYTTIKYRKLPIDYKPWAYMSLVELI